MRIIVFVNNNSGPSYHRIIMPLLLMSSEVEVYITNNLLVEHFDKGCDIFMYNRILPDHCAEQITILKKKFGFKTVVDIDDFWELDPYHVLYKTYVDDGFAAQQIKHITAADAVLTTHERLAAEIRPYNTNVHVCPNAIPHQGQFDVETIPHRLIRLFWQGSETHKEDIQILEAPIERLGRQSKRLQMVMGGYHRESEPWGSMVEVYTAKIKHQYKIIPYAPITSYYGAYREADICLVPLVNSKFNRMKSNLKVLEAANMALPVIASAVHPYLGMPINYCRNSRDWIGHIKRLVQFPARRVDEGIKLAEYCQEHFNFEKINTERLQILEHEAGK